MIQYIPPSPRLMEEVKVEEEDLPSLEAQISSA
jgi:hypothetical protein